MAAVHSYQRVLLANRDILLSELPTDKVLNFLEDHNALSIKEIDDIKIGRSHRERIESLLDVLHYKGERVFNEFCKALDEYSPKLAARMSDKDSQIDRTDKYYNERNTISRYTSSYSDHDRGYREINGDDFHRDFDRDRDERDSKLSDMRGEQEPHYAQVQKRPRDVDRIADDNRSVSSHHSRHSERGSRGDDYYRKAPRRADELHPAEHYILEKQTIHLEKANANQGFGIAVSGGLDNPHYKTGDTSIVVSDIVTGSPAHGLLRDNDIIVQVNDVNVERCYHREAVQALKDAGTSARLIIKRRKIMPPGAVPSDSKMDRSYQSATLPDRRSKSMPPTTVIHLKKPEKEGFGFSMAFRLYIKDVKRKGVAHYGGLQRDHVIQRINGKKTEELSLKEAIEMVRNSKDLELVVADKKLDKYASTRSLPSVGKKGYENGIDASRDEEPIDRRRAKSLDRKYIKEQRRSRRPSDGDKDIQVGDRPLHDGLSIEHPVELDKSSKLLDKTIEPLDKPIEHRFEHDIKPLEVKQELRDAPDDVFKALESIEKPPEPVVIKHEVKVEETLPDIPPRRYSDTEPPKSLQLDEKDRGIEASWKRLQPYRDDERDSDRGHRDNDDRYSDSRERYNGRDREDNQPYVPQPADVTRTAGNIDLSMNAWDQGLSPGRGPPGDTSRDSTPQSQRREKLTADFINDRDTKSIFFRKEGSLGIQIQGGNKVGIFVNAVRENNPAYKQGLRRGDQILMANDIDFKDITREEAVLLLLSLGDEVSLYARPKMSTYERIKNSPGDSFYIKCHFDYTKMKPEELDMNREDVFHVWDTMHNGMIGSWHAQRVTLNNDETETGIIPNKCRAEQLATVRQVEEDKAPKKAQRTNSLKRIKTAGLKKHKSTDRLDTESFVNVSKEFKLPAYERVSLRSPGFVRPVVLLGPISDITRDKLLQDMPDVFAVPTAFGGEKGLSASNPLMSSRRTLSYNAIKAVVDSGKHCVVDIAPDEVERLNYCQFYPIVIFLKTPNKAVLKDLRTQHGSTGKNVKKVYDNSVKIENVYSNMFSATIPAGANDDWYNKVKEEIRRQQDRRVWMSEDKFDNEDMEFRLHPARYSIGQDYDPHGDSPTNRSSVSHPPDEDIHVQSNKELESAPTQLYNGPQVEYRSFDDERNRLPYDDERDRDRGGYDDERHRDRGGYDDERGRGRYDDERDRGRYDDGRDRGRYDDERDRGRYGDIDHDRGRYVDEIPYDGDVDRASKPGYKPIGNVVKVLPSSQEPSELRNSLRKTRPASQDFADHPPDLNDGERVRDSLRKTDYDPRYDGPNPTELELKHTAESLRKVEAKPDVLNQYDERVGVKVSDLWAIDRELNRDLAPPKIDKQVQPVEVIDVESKPDDFGKILDDLPAHIPTSEPKSMEPIHKPFLESKPRNVIIDNRPGERAQSTVRTTVYPRKTFATVTHVSSKSEPEVRTEVTNRVESAPVENGYRSLPHNYGRRSGQPIYRTEYTLPSSRQERPKSAYGYSSQAYAPKPFGTEYRSASPPPRPAQPVNYDYRLSKPTTELRREPEPRPMTYRSDYRARDYEPYKDDTQAITSDFESLDDDTQVVATARGTFTSEGGVLSSPETGVSIHIPQGAIERGKEQEIYFKVCKDNNIMPPLDADKGETLLSPLVMCGPHGTQFLKPVELRLPHCASMTPDGWSFALKSSDTPSGMPTTWKNVSLPGQENKDKCQVDPNSVSVLVDHF